MDLYVYYQARDGDALAVRSAVESMQEKLRRVRAVRCGLKQRPRLNEEHVEREEREGRDTWMEIYLAVPVGFEETLAAAVAASDLPRLIVGDRHVEHFLDSLPCA